MQSLGERASGEERETMKMVNVVMCKIGEGVSCVVELCEDCWQAFSRDGLIKDRALCAVCRQRLAAARKTGRR